MTRVFIPAAISVSSAAEPLDEMADSVVRFVLWRMEEEPATAGWSAGLALTCFAPPMSAALRSEVHRRLSSILAK